MEGYIKLHRKLLDNPLCTRIDYLGLWTYLLLRANHKEAELMSDVGVIKLKSGQFITSRDTIAISLGVKASKVQRMLKRLEIGQQIKQETNNRFRIITIVNWDKYQKNEQQTDSKANNKRTTDEQQTDTNKNDKNVKNDKKDTMQPAVSDEINPLIELFKSINPSYKTLYSNTTQRSCLKRLLKELGREKLELAINTVVQTNGMDYAPVITTPYELEKKLGSLMVFIKKQGINNSNVEKIR